MKQSILILSIMFLVFYCKPERSCENCIEIIPPRTIPNELITSGSIYIEDESLVRYIYPEVKTVVWPGHHLIFAKIPMDGRKQYDTTFNLKDYLDMDKYKIGDSFFVRYEIRWKFEPATYYDIDTLIY